MVRCLFIRCRLDSALKNAQARSTNENWRNAPKELADCVRRSSLEETEIIYRKFARVRLSEFLRSSPALPDCFTSSNLLLIRSVISDKCGRRHAERGILAQSRLAHPGSDWITRHSEKAAAERPERDQER